MQKRVPENQLALNFDALVDEYIEVKTDLVDAAKEQVKVVCVENEFEACIEIAAAIKRTYRSVGMSREQLLDGINAYFGRSEEGAKENPPSCRKPLSLDMLNNHLSKPAEYPLPAYLLYAIHHVTGVIEPGATILAAEGAQVATAEEIRLLQIGKLEQTLDDLRKLRTELRGRKR